MGQSCPIGALFATSPHLFASQKIYLQLPSLFATFFLIFARFNHLFEAKEPKFATINDICKFELYICKKCNDICNFL